MHYVISDIHNDYQKFFTEEKSVRYYGFELGTNTEKIKENAKIELRSSVCSLQMKQLM